MNVLWLLFVAHLMTDFIQPVWLLKLRKEKWWGYELHIAIYMFLNIFILYQFTGRWILWSLILGGSHLLIDRAKHAYQKNHFKFNVGAFLIDQTLHFLTIVAVVKIGRLASDKPFYLIETQTASVFAGYLMASFAVSILVFELSKNFKGNGFSENSILKWPDRFLGMIERSAGLTLLLKSYYPFVPLVFLPSLVMNNNKKKLSSILIEQAVSLIAVVLIGLAIGIKR
jgi:hypothetical protein